MSRWPLFISLVVSLGLLPVKFAVKKANKRWWWWSLALPNGLIVNIYGPLGEYVKWILYRWMFALIVSNLHGVDLGACWGDRYHTFMYEILYYFKRILSKINSTFIIAKFPHPFLNFLDPPLISIGMDILRWSNFTIIDSPACCLFVCHML